MALENENIIVDPLRQEKAKEYSRISRRLWAFEMLWSGIYAGLWLFLGWSSGLKNILEQYFNHFWLLVAAFVILYSLLDGLLSLPLTWYSSFVLPHRYEMSDQTLKSWILDEIKGLAVGGVLGIVLIEVVYLLLRNFPDTWWLWASAVMLAFNVLLANLYPLLIAPLFNKYIPLGEEHADLEERLLKLALKTGTRIQGVYKFDMSRQTRAANAGLTGIGKSRRIVLGDTMINEFTADEIEVVLAHELGHQVFHDIPLGIASGTLTTLFGFYLASLGLNLGAVYFGFEGVWDIAALPLLSLAVGFYSLLIMPLSNLLSRWQEKRADLFALKTTGKVESFISAFTRLANQNLAELEPEPWVEFLLHSHPALSKRIKMAVDFQKGFD